MLVAAADQAASSLGASSHVWCVDGRTAPTAQVVLASQGHRPPCRHHEVAQSRASVSSQGLVAVVKGWRRAARQSSEILHWRESLQQPEAPRPKRTSITTCGEYVISLEVLRAAKQTEVASTRQRTKMLFPAESRGDEKTGFHSGTQLVMVGMLVMMVKGTVGERAGAQSAFLVCFSPRGPPHTIAHHRGPVQVPLTVL